MRNYLILQPFGLGDCIFAQGIAKHLKHIGGGNIYWPVKEHFWADLKRAYPEIKWLYGENFSGLDDVEIAAILNATVAPIRWSDTIMGVPYNEVMRAKYDMYNLDWTSWDADAKWVRSLHKEAELFNLFNFREGSPFNLVSTTYGSDFENIGNINVRNGLPTIYISKLEGYSLFDWAYLMERATEIHFVSSSNIYLLECLDLRAKEIHLYPRHPLKNHDQYKYILRKHKYILH